MHIAQLSAAIKKGDRAALARAISLAENDPSKASALMKRVGNGGKAFVLGVTGPPGTGKSTLVDRLIESLRAKGLRVGVIAVDPTSPLTGGALLGDRIRMTRHTGDRSVYIRSMASRGWSGGLSMATAQAIRLVDAAGFDIILLETVGIGQSDIEVVGVSHAVLVVLMPGLGDDVQISKAGLMEVGDVYVVNKADLEGADRMVVDILSLFQRGRHRPPVLKVSARSGEGLEKLLRSVDEIRGRFVAGDEALRLRGIRGIIVETARGAALARFAAVSEAKADRLARLVAGEKITVEEAAARLAA
ncbi:MAG: methylmalonyl Co-A mutase-associated GTPase MeaB [Nitrososphaerota archaeon]|nr:methylmalonyl Co-A mutase-associated GTPase MeaB [Nitrososphaerota archaeon]MDG6973693.1 methylmalonyl Co-A mutase-associated GTPase MeaB [Nitrososphaerota archaeon]MDG6975483.1 methylmalonyl Co-A mutase-associated GTPase MeaB [Nitrososphaerota archaeon]